MTPEVCSVANNDLAMERWCGAGCTGPRSCTEILVIAHHAITKFGRTSRENISSQPMNFYSEIVQQKSICLL